MSSREAFRIFIRHQLHVMNDEGYVDLPNEAIEKLSNFIENDYSFYERLSELLTDYIVYLDSNDSELI